MKVTAVQRRTLRLLFVTQIISGVGVAVGASVGALLAADIAGVSVSGLAQSAAVVGTALFAIPATAIVNRQGRRPSLALLYLVAAVGAIIVVVAAMRGSIPLLFLGFFLFGAATAANFQARYAAVDLAPTALRGRHLSLIVWATTIGAVLGPSLAPVAGKTVARFGVPTLAGPYFFSALLFALAILLLTVFLRPDPAVVARTELGHPSSPVSDAPRPGMRAALAVRAVASRGSAGRHRHGHRERGHGRRDGDDAGAHQGGRPRRGPHPRHRGAGAQLSYRGDVRVLAGVRLVDRPARTAPGHLHRYRLAARRLRFGGNAGHITARLAAALMALGLGWSAAMVAGSTLLSESVPVELRASAQGLSDLVMGLAGATAGAISGVIVAAWGYSMLTLFAAVMTAPLIVSWARGGRGGINQTGSSEPRLSALGGQRRWRSRSRDSGPEGEPALVSMRLSPTASRVGAAERRIREERPSYGEDSAVPRRPAAT